MEHIRIEECDDNLFVIIDDIKTRSKLIPFINKNYTYENFASFLDIIWILKNITAEQFTSDTQLSGILNMPHMKTRKKERSQMWMNFCTA
jgi:hypothetical protein